MASLGKVVGSIQGLQQRLDDFTIDELSQADDQCKTLISHLTELQQKLGALAEIQRTVVAVKSAIDGMPDESIDLSNLGIIDKPLQLQAIAQASKLLNFRRRLKRIKETAKKPTLEPTAHIAENSAAESLSPEVPQMPVDFVPNDTAKNAGAIVVSLDFEPPKQKAEVIKLGPTTAAQADKGFVAKPELRAESQAKNPSDFASSSKTVATSPSNASPSSGETVRGGMALVPANTEFDQQLLDDLIKNYGEFATSPNLPATTEPEKKRTQEHQERTAPAATENNSRERRLPSLKREGEIDRQLKKLVRDYGEYDLYPRQSPINLKIGVLAAFLLMGAVFSGFYFFSSPPSVATPIVSETDRSTAGADPAETEVGGGNGAATHRSDAPNSPERRGSRAGLGQK